MDSYISPDKTYRMRALPTDPAPDLPAFAQIISLWRERREPDGLPLRASFEMTDFRGLVGNVAISERDGDDFRFRLYGEAFRQILGRELTGELLCASLSDELVEPTKKHFQLLLDGPMIGHTSGSAPVSGREFRDFEVLDLPTRMVNGEDGFLHLLSTGPTP